MTRKSWTKAAWLACGLAIVSAPGWAGNDAALKELKDLGGPETARAIATDAEPKTVPIAAADELSTFLLYVSAQKCGWSNGEGRLDTPPLAQGLWKVKVSDFVNRRLKRTAGDDDKGTMSVTMEFGQIGQKPTINVATKYVSKIKNTLGPETANLSVETYVGERAIAYSGGCDVPSDAGTITLRISMDLRN